jgi:alkane 1-monooxygenase
MGRHSDHHRRPAAAYQALSEIGNAPELPLGYAGSILLALVPPLWRRVMDPRASGWRKIIFADADITATVSLQ